MEIVLNQKISSIVIVLFRIQEFSSNHRTFDPRCLNPRNQIKILYVLLLQDVVVLVRVDDIFLALKSFLVFQRFRSDTDKLSAKRFTL